MNYKNIQEIFIIYGTKKEINKTIHKLNHDKLKINILKIKKDSHSIFKDLKRYLWKGD